MGIRSDILLGQGEVDRAIDRSEGWNLYGNIMDRAKDRFGDDLIDVLMAEWPAPTYQVRADGTTWCERCGLEVASRSVHDQYHQGNSLKFRLYDHQILEAEARIRSLSLALDLTGISTEELHERIAACENDLGIDPKELDDILASSEGYTAEGDDSWMQAAATAEEYQALLDLLTCCPEGHHTQTYGCFLSLVDFEDPIETQMEVLNDIISSVLATAVRWAEKGSLEAARSSVADEVRRSKKKSKKGRKKGQ